MIRHLVVYITLIKCDNVTIKYKKNITYLKNIQMEYISIPKYIN